jgi:hypothetical protein
MAATLQTKNIGSTVFHGFLKKTQKDFVFIFIEKIDGFVYRPPRMLQQFMLQILLMLHPEHNSKSCSSSSGPNRCFIFDLVKALETWLKRDNYKYIRTKVKERITNADHCT